MITDYKIINAGEISGKDISINLAEQVKEAIEEGWQPLGGVATLHLPADIQSDDPIKNAFNKDSVFLFQALVKYAQE